MYAEHRLSMYQYEMYFLFIKRKSTIFSNNDGRVANLDPSVLLLFDNYPFIHIDLTGTNSSQSCVINTFSSLIQDNKQKLK